MNGGELEHDIAVGALPSGRGRRCPIMDDAARSEAPGKPFDPGIAYVQSLVNAIAASPYQDDTLVLVTYLTAGRLLRSRASAPAAAARRGRLE